MENVDAKIRKINLLPRLSSSEINKLFQKILDANASKKIKAPTTVQDIRKKAMAEGASLALGWTVAEVCLKLERGEDPRKAEIPEMAARMFDDLGLT